MSRCLPVLIAVFSALALMAGPASASRGGPDGFGYSWRDDREPDVAYTRFDFQPPPVVVYVTEPGIDRSTPFLTLPWPFPYYGRTFSVFSMSEDGWLSLASQLVSDASPSPIPSVDGPLAMIAPLWEPLILGPRGGGDFMRYQVDTDKVVIEWFKASVNSTGEDATFQVWLHQDGRIRFQYLNVAGPHPGATIGIEDDTATIGLAIMTGGVGGDGFTVRARSVIEILPPSAAICGTDIACGEVLSDQVRRNPDDMPRHEACGTFSAYPGAEKIYTLHLTELTHVAAALTAGQVECDVFLLPACTDLACLAMGDAVTLDFAPPGDYQIVVDAIATNTGFGLGVACEPALVPATCGSQSGTLGTTDRVSSWPCVAGAMGAGEVSYFVTLPADADLVASLDRIDLAVVISTLEGYPRASGCLSGAMGSTWATSLGAGDYVVTVDGPATTVGAFTLTLSCDPPRTQATTCGATITRTLATTGSLDGWPCASGPLPGGENLHSFSLSALATLTLRLSSSAPAEMLLLDGAMEGPAACLARGDTFLSYPNAPPGAYVVVVDSLSGADYTLEIACDEPVGGACTPWEAHDGDVPITGLFGYTIHGESREFELATPPPADDPGWLPATDTGSIGYARSSSICGHACFSALDYTYFRTYVRMPTTVTSFQLRFGVVDDGVQIRINGVPHAEVPFPGGATRELAGAPSLRAGALNEILLVQVDDCCSWNELSGVSCFVAGTDPPCTATITTTPSYNAQPSDVLALSALGDVANCFDVAEYRWSLRSVVLRDWDPDPNYSHVVGNDDELLLVEVRCRRDATCTASATLAITVPPCSVALDDPLPASACAGQSVALAPPGPAAFTNCWGTPEYRWLSGVIVLQDWSALASLDHVVGSSAETLTVEVRCNDRPACTDSASVLVTPLGGVAPEDVTPNLRVRKNLPGDAPLLYWTGANAPAYEGHFHVYRTVYPARTWLRVNADMDLIDWLEPSPSDGWLLWYIVRSADGCEVESSD